MNLPAQREPRVSNWRQATAHIIAEDYVCWNCGELASREQPHACDVGDDPAPNIPTHQALRRVCLWCDPPHVTQEGIEPTSHGLCAEALAKWTAELDAMEAVKV